MNISENLVKNKQLQSTMHLDFPIGIILKSINRGKISFVGSLLKTGKPWIGLINKLNNQAKFYIENSRFSVYTLIVSKYYL